MPSTASIPPQLNPTHAILGKEVDPSHIHKELKTLWQLADSHTTASLMNLAIYSEVPDSLIHNAVIINKLTQDHACRAIIVERNPFAENTNSKAWIHAHCHLVQGKKSVCCEQIALLLNGTVQGRLGNTIFAHLHSDLPLVLWWQGQIEDYILKDMIPSIDRLIVDSSEWNMPQHTFQFILEKTQKRKKFILQDMEWSRSWQIRSGIATLFDHPVAQQALDDIHTLQIKYHPNHRNATLQLIIWLSMQAGWSLPESLQSTDQVFTLNWNQQQPIQVHLQADVTYEPIHEVCLMSSKTSILVAHQNQSYFLKEIKHPDGTIASTYPADKTSQGELLSQQLARSGVNSLFQKILPDFIKLIG